jgi:hypothetical protein
MGLVLRIPQGLPRHHPMPSSPWALLNEYVMHSERSGSEEESGPQIRFVAAGQFLVTRISTITGLACAFGKRAERTDSVPQSFDDGQNVGGNGWISFLLAHR